jgi:hypothetical protein
MVEKINALCRAIDTVASLPACEETDARLDELTKLLVEECQKMANPTVAPVTRSAQAENVYGEKAAEDIFPPQRPYDKDIDNPLPENWIANNYR